MASAWTEVSHACWIARWQCPHTWADAGAGNVAAVAATLDARSSAGIAANRMEPPSARLHALLARHRREELHESPKDHERENQQDQGREQTLAGREAHLVARVPEEALREELPADDHVP